MNKPADRPGNARRLPEPSPLARHWGLDPGLVHLNHGSFGACPKIVLDAQRGYRDRMEREAVSFFCVDLWELLDRARRAVAGVVGASWEDVVFLPNATTAVATVLENVARGVGLEAPLGPGDEVLTTSHDYPACRFNLARVAARAGAGYVEVPFPTPATHATPIVEDDIVEAVLSGVTRRTRLAMLSQITSPSGVAMPVARLCRLLGERGVMVVVDGAHGPGAVDFDLPALGAAFYTSNCHKWLCSPKGAAMLWVRRDLQKDFRPLVLSNSARLPGGRRGRGRFATEFGYIGTDDYTPMCAVADAVGALPEIAGTDWPGIIRANRDLVLRGRDILVERLGLDRPYADGLIGPMAALELPRVAEGLRGRLASRPTAYADALQDALVERHGVQVPVWRSSDQLGGQEFDGRRTIRISAQLYNSEAQYTYLADALAAELEAERGAG
ncbi:MAG TPA: aminotransferase class V-fold PLP-dependent enzyme [Phycisphaerales bacterium]|nr:aminotransferase class V-fold PLP-dependent enzyme [Phycisphaerales bacterium]